jgi:hypothetical protein
MIIDLHSNIKDQIKKLKSIQKLYDFIIIGTGPASTILIENLIKMKKKILVLERGDFKQKKYEKINCSNFLIKEKSRTFAVGGSSEDWSQIYSYFSNDEMCNFKNKNVWPLKYSELLKWYNKINIRYNFDTKALGLQKIYDNKFYIRKFIENKSPTRFSNFFNDVGYDIIINCKVEALDEIKSYTSSFFKIDNKIYKVKSKKLIICAGGIESTLLLLNSLKQKKLKSIRNKNIIGRYFMDHPKSYVGELKYPKIELIKNFKLKSGLNTNVYHGISLYIKNQRLLNTYIRFEVKRVFFKIKKKIMIKIFLEMVPKYNNRVYIEKKKPKINLTVDNKEIVASKNLLKKIINTFSHKPKFEKLTFKKKNLVDASHHIGGMAYPKVVNKNLKIQGLKNIYCCSSSVFPTSGSANPTLTICALAERLSYYFKKK